MSGAATCFYAFIGFDIISISGEESSKPTKHVPVATLLTLVICLSAYVGVSSVLTLMVPWDKLNAYATLPNAFAQVQLIAWWTNCQCLLRAGYPTGKIGTCLWGGAAESRGATNNQDETE